MADFLKTGYSPNDLGDLKWWLQILLDYRNYIFELEYLKYGHSPAEDSGLLMEVEKFHIDKIIEASVNPIE